MLRIHLHFEQSQVFSFAESLGGVESLITYQRRKLTLIFRQKCAILMVRQMTSCACRIGLKDSRDLLQIFQALERIKTRWENMILQAAIV